MELSLLKNLQQKFEEGTFLWIAEDWDNEQFKNYVQDIDRQFKNGDIFYNDRNTLAILKAKEYSALKRDIVAKKFNLNTKYAQFRFRFLKSKAVRSLIIATALKELGIKTPTPIAVVEERGKNNKIIYSYYLTEYIPYDYSLLDIIKQENHPYQEKILSFLPQIARDVRKMHDAGILHNDLHAGNILIKNISDNPEFFYIDLNRARIKNKLNEKKRIKDLARFKFSLKEQEVFLEYYAPKGHLKLLNLLIKMRRKRERIINYKRNLKRIFK